MKRLLILLGVIAGLLGTPVARAEDLSPTRMQQCIRAAVRVGMIDAEGNVVGSGSGTIIDPRGYVLTNYHLIGDPRLGTVFQPGGMVRLGLVRSSREAVSYDWFGQVVRADPRRDLALIRIVSHVNGSNVGGMQFPNIPVAPNTDHLQAGAKVWVVGFPSGARTVNVTSGSINGFEVNLEREVAWLRTDAEINPGNSGGQLVDSQGRLVGIPTQVAAANNSDVFETIGFARPTESIPVAWLRGLTGGHLTGMEVEGNFLLEPGAAITGEMVGDGMYLDMPEVHFYRLPASGRAGMVEVSVQVPVMVLDDNMEVLREGNGRVAVDASNRQTIVALFFAPESLESAFQYTVRFTPRSGASPRVAADSPAPPQYTEKVPRGHRPAAVSSFVFRGYLVDGVSGRSLQGMVLIGNPGSDLEGNILRYIEGALPERVFRDLVQEFTVTAEYGFYINDLPSDSIYPVVVSSTGYRPYFFTLSAEPGQPEVNAGPIRLAR